VHSTYSTRGRDEKCMKRDQLKDLGVHGRIILKLI
jgi:hypothetical protein